MSVLAMAAALSIGAGAAAPGNAWEREIVYQIFPRSFRDSNGDRVGDLRGIAQGLDYVKSLGCTAILLNPIVKARVYHNYFADDFFSIDPSFGTMKDFSELIAQAHKKRIKVILDMEPQYVADGHPWFKESALEPKKSSANRVIVGSAFGSSPPWYNKAHVGIASVNLNLPDVRKETSRVFEFWADKGVDGFRIDHMMDDLDNRHVNNDLYARLWEPIIQKVRAKHPKAFFIGEQSDWGKGEDILTKTSTDAIYAFRMQSALISLDKSKLEREIRWLASTTPSDRTQFTFLENHDMNRFASIETNTRKQRLAATLLYTLKGTPIIYYGQELGMKGKQGKWGSDGNDIPIRLAFRWGETLDDSHTATWYKGSGPWAEPTYSADHDGISLAEQDSKNDSLLNYYRLLGKLRLKHPALRQGSLELLDVSQKNVLAFRRTAEGETALIIANLGGSPASYILADGGSDLLSGGRFKAGATVKLMPYQARVIKLRN